MGRLLGFALLLLLVGWAGDARADDADGTYAGKDARWWIGQLLDRDGATAAYVALKKIGTPALEPLAEALSSDRPALRHGAARALKVVRGDLTPLLPKLLAALKGDDPVLQVLVLPLFHRVGLAGAAHLKAIMPLLRSPNRNLLPATLSLLQSWADQARPALPLVLDVARSGPPRQRLRALAVAIVLAPDAAEIVPVARRLFEHGDDRQRRSVITTLGKLQPEVSGLDALVVLAARDPLPGVRAAAASLLGAIALEVPERQADLIALLGDADRDVQMRAAYAVMRLGSRAGAAAAAPLERILEDPDGSAHVAALRALAAIGQPGEHAFPLVMHLLDTSKPSRELKYAAQAYLAARVPLTLKALEQEDPRVQAFAIRIVSGWSPERWAGALPRLIGPLQAVLLHAAAPGTYEGRILERIGRLAPDHPAALKALLAMSAARSKTIRSQAARLLGAQSGQAALLLELFSGTNPAERAFAEDALLLALRMRGQAVQARLLALLQHEDADLRERAARLLVRSGLMLDPATLGEPQAKALAAAAAGLLAVPADRGKAVSLLGRLGSHALPYADALLALLGETGTGPAWALATIARSSALARELVEPRLLAFLAGADPVVAAQAALAVGALGSHDDLLLRHLPALMKSANKWVYYPAVDAAGNLGVRAAPLLPLLIELVAEPTAGTHVEINALAALTRMAPDDVRVVRVALQGLADPRRKDQANAYLGLLRSGGEHAIDLMADALVQARAETQVQLLGVLARFRLRASRVRDRVRPLVESPDARVARQAKATLEALGS